MKLALRRDIRVVEKKDRVLRSHRNAVLMKAAPRQMPNAAKSADTVMAGMVAAIVRERVTVHQRDICAVVVDSVVTQLALVGTNVAEISRFLGL
jgi:DeoR/GlpR family transcriptional regulator of sugar metabolism